MRSTRGMSRSARLEALPEGQAACGIERSGRSMPQAGGGMKGGHRGGDSAAGLTRQPPPVDGAVVAIRAHGAGYQVVRDALEIVLQFGMKPAELLPHDAVELPLADAHHDRRPPLPGIAVGMHPVLAADRDEQPHRPRVGQRVLILLLRVGAPVPAAQAVCSETSCDASGWKSRRRSSQFGAVVISGRCTGRPGNLKART